MQEVYCILLTLKRALGILRINSGRCYWNVFNQKEPALNNPIRRARPERTGVRAPLGDLELAVMRHVWDCEAQGCQGADIQQVLERQRPTALTTVLTTLDRLREKGIVRREREGKAYRYWAVLDEEQLQERIVTGVMDRLIAQFPKAVAAYFAQQEMNGQEDAAGLSDLVKRVAAAGSLQGGTDQQSKAVPEGENSDGR